MKKIFSVLIIAAIVLAGVIFVPELAHNCDSCDKFFIGTGYKPNVLSELVNEDSKIICKDCAETQHALAIALGQSLDEFKRDLFE